MSFEFDDQNNLMRNYESELKQKGMINKLIKWKIAKDEKTANLILVVSAIIIISLSIGLFLYTKSIDKQKAKVDYRISEDIVKRLPMEIRLDILSK